MQVAAAFFWPVVLFLIGFSIRRVNARTCLMALSSKVAKNVSEYGDP